MRSIALALAALDAFLFMSKAKAAEIDFSAALKDQDGKAYEDCIGKYDPAKEPPCDKTVEVTLGRFALNALNFPDREPMSGEEFQKRSTLARRIYKASKIDLDADEIKLIKDQIRKMPGVKPMVWLAAIELLDPASLKSK